MYCPWCKTYDIEKEYDQVENIKKFMTLVENEHARIEAKKARLKKKATKERLLGVKKLSGDSISQITDLEEPGILHMYFEETMTALERKQKERLNVQARLLGQQPPDFHFGHKDCCGEKKKKLKRAMSARSKRRTIRMELRQVEDGVSMMDESHSAHQFSVKEMSVQADSEARLDAEMQTSVINMKS